MARRKVTRGAPPRIARSRKRWPSARTRREGAAPSKAPRPAGDEDETTLGAYFKEMSSLDVMSPEEELAAATRIAELREEHWRRLLDVLRERRRSGSSGASGVANGGAFDTTTVWSDEAPSAPPARPPAGPDDATVALDDALRGPGLLGEPDVPVPSALVEAPDAGLFSPDGRALTPPLHPVEPGAILADPVPIAGPDLGEVTVVEAPPQPEAPAITDAPALPDAPARPDAPEPEQTMSGQAVVTGWQTAEPQWGQAPPGADDGSAPAQPRLPGFDDTGQHR